MQSEFICGSKQPNGSLLLIRFPQCRIPAAFRILTDINLPWPTTYRAVFYVGLAVSSALIDFQLYGFTAIGTDLLKWFHHPILSCLYNKNKTDSSRSFFDSPVLGNNLNS
jgi:hypothetical protein